MTPTDRSALSVPNKAASPVARLPRWLRPALLGLLAPLLIGGCGSEVDTTADGVPIGLLLPFTGPDAATASNFERAVIYAVGRVNAGGGINGKRLRLVSKDTHSDLGRSRQAAQALIDEGVSVVIGPESPEIAAELLPVFTAAKVVLVSPLVGAAGEVTLDCSHPWFRLAPSAKALGEAMGKQLRASLVTKVAVLKGSGAYNQAVAAAAADRFSSLGGQVVDTATLKDEAQSYVDVLTPISRSGAEAIILAASPRTGALTINESSVLHASNLFWSLSPLLKTDLFLQNVDPSKIEGAVGVAPKIYETDGAFAAAFASRWSGDLPLEGAYFYYDAVALIGLALQRATLAGDGTPEVDELEQALIGTAAPPGEPMSWSELEIGLQRQRSGNEVYYSGLTGPMLLTSCGARRLGLSSPWTVESGRVVEATD
jgi:ABC-type branched-subunit amino acid transport system substrate-binding protein